MANEREAEISSTESSEASVDRGNKEDNGKEDNGNKDSKLREANGSKNSKDSFKSRKAITTPGLQMPAISKNSNVIAGLRSLGLNEYEAKAYYALACSNTCTAGELSTRAQLPRPRVYDVLASLQDQGFVALKPGRPVKYSSLPLGEVVETLKKQRRTALEKEFTHVDNVSKDLQSKLKGGTLAGEFAVEDNVWTLKGKDAINSKLASMLQDAKQNIILNSTPAGLAQKLKAHGHLLHAARNRGVKIHIVTPKGAPDVTQLAHTTTSASLPTRFVLADEQALMFLTDESVHPDDEVGLWLKSPHITQTLKQLVQK